MVARLDELKRIAEGMLRVEGRIDLDRLCAEADRLGVARAECGEGVMFA